MSNSIYPCLWFDGQAKEAASFYCSIFNNSKITSENPMVVMFDLEGQKTMALNGGPMFKLNPSISFFVNCTSVDEVDTLWQKLSDGGSTLMSLDTYPWSPKYGWVKDKFGLTWQLMLGDIPAGMPKITPSFLFSNNQFGKAKAAIEYYTSVFPNSKINTLELYAENEVQAVGNVKFAQFELNNKQFVAMDGPGNHEFEFNEGFSLVVDCANQEEIDFYWEKLTLVGQESMCGWLKDQFGVSWQIVPQILGSLMNNPEKANNVIQAFLKMRKFDIQTLLDA